MVTRRLWWVVAGLWIAAVGLSGCGPDLFGPPARARPSSSTEQESKARTVFMITPGVPTNEVLSWAIEAQTESNIHHAIFKMIGPAEGESSLNQPEVVQRAINDGASALVVVAGDSPELGKVLAEAESRGIVVVSIARPIPVPEGSKPITVVEIGSLEASTKRVVEAIIDDLKAAGRKVEGTALVLADTRPDPSAAKRVATLKAAATAAGFPKVVEVPIDGTNAAEARNQAIAASKANPETAIILADDPEALVAGTAVLDDRKGLPPAFLGGYLAFKTNQTPIPMTRMSAYAQGRFDQLGALAVKTALSKLDGKTFGDRVFLEPIYHRVDDDSKRVAVPIPAQTSSEAATPAKPKIIPKDPAANQP